MINDDYCRVLTTKCQASDATSRARHTPESGTISIPLDAAPSPSIRTSDSDQTWFDKTAGQPFWSLPRQRPEGVSATDGAKQLLSGAPYNVNGPPSEGLLHCVVRPTGLDENLPVRQNGRTAVLVAAQAAPRRGERHGWRETAPLGHLMPCKALHVRALLFIGYARRI